MSCSWGPKYDLGVCGDAPRCEGYLVYVHTATLEEAAEVLKGLGVGVNRRAGLVKRERGRRREAEEILRAVRERAVGRALGEAPG